MATRVCWLIGHKFSAVNLTCCRCGRTDQALERLAAGDADASGAYWRGVQDGRLIDRTRAYSLGMMRVARFATGDGGKPRNIWREFLTKSAQTPEDGKP